MKKSARELPSTAVGRRRLLKGAALLEADAKRTDGIKFDFSVVGIVEDQTKPLSCGTVGCALGLFGVSRAFEKQGLTYRVSQHGGLRLRYPRAGNSFSAAARLFQITEAESHFLFLSADGLPTITGARAERAVAKRIRDFVAGKSAPTTAR